MLAPADSLLIAHLAFDPQQWVHRRVEQVMYLDDRSVRRRISIDFSVPVHESEAPELLLPVAQFDKQPLVNFDFRNEAGEPIPMLTTEQNGAITTEVLRQLARLPDPDLPDFITDKYIERLVFSAEDGERDEALYKVFQPGTSVGDTLSAFTPFRVLAEDAARNFFVYVPVPTTDRGRRRVVKVGFDRGEEVGAPRSARERFGLKPVEDGFFVPAAGSAASYHIEIIPPQDMRYVSAVFIGFRNDELVMTEAHDLSAGRAHVNASNLDRGTGLIVVEARTDSAVLTGAMIFALLTAATMWFLRARVHSLVSTDGADAVVGATVALPGVALAYIMRATEHAVASAFLVGFRAVALCTALVSFAAAIVLFSGYDADELRGPMTVFAVVSSIGAGLLTAGWLAQLSSSRRKR